MIPSSLFPFRYALRNGAGVASVQMPSHDLPVVWRRFTGEGGCAMVEHAGHPVLAGVHSFDPNKLPLLEPVGKRRSVEL